jgi:hypothetical protein
VTYIHNGGFEMVKLTITALNSGVTVQDPRAVTQSNEEQAVISVEAGNSSTVDMQWQQLERIANQLNELTDLGFCTFTIDASDAPGFVRQPDAVNNPSLEVVPGGIAFDGSADVDIVGTDLTAGSWQATASLTGDAGAGLVLLNVTEPGFAGNSYDAVVVDSESGGLDASIAVVDGRNVLTVDLGGATVDCDAVAAAVDAVAGVNATVTGTGSTNVSVQDLVAFTGGSGTGMSITLGGAACTINSVSESAGVYTINIDTPDLTGTAVATDTVKLRLRCDEKEDLATVVLA